MERITAYRTRDGQTFADHRAAYRHAEKMYGEKLSSIAHKLLRAEKYGAMLEAIESNAEAFAELTALRADMVLVVADELED